MTDTEELSRKVEQLTEKVNTLTTQVTALLNMWEQAKGMITFIKATVWIAGTVGAFFLFIKPYLSLKI